MRAAKTATIRKQVQQEFKALLVQNTQTVTQNRQNATLKLGIRRKASGTYVRFAYKI